MDTEEPNAAREVIPNCTHAHARARARSHRHTQVVACLHVCARDCVVVHGCSHARCKLHLGAIFENWNIACELNSILS